MRSLNLWNKSTLLPFHWNNVKTKVIMVNPETKSFDKERIKSRILRRAAELWGYRESEIDSFDPIVKLLIEAFAGELEKISYEINETQLRVIERLTGLINPELDVVKPAHGILQTRALDAGTRLNRDTQFLVKKGEDRTKSNGGRENADIFFSPVDEYRVYNGSLLYYISQRNAYTFESGTKSIAFIEHDGRDFEEYNTLWLGLDIEEDTEFFEGMSFFFNWHNEPQKVLFSQYLPLVEWYLHDGIKLNTRVGLNPLSSDRTTVSLEQLFDISRKLEAQVSSLWNNYFITITKNNENNPTRIKLKYPAVFERKFSAQELNLFKKETYWIRLKFPEFCPPEILTNIAVALNCFPVINRKMHRITYKTQQLINVIGLDSSDSFLAVKDVRNDSNKVYKGIPLAGLNEQEVATYSVRSAINRLDQRQARELLSYLLELLQDESASFESVGEDFLTSQIIELNQNIARLEQRLKRRSDNQSSNPYLVLNSVSPGETVFIEYWSTRGEGANTIPAGSKAMLFSGSFLNNNLTFLLNTTTGGRAKPKGEQKINLLKKSLLSRDRIVTTEDVKVACWEALSTKARDIRVKKVFETGKTPSMGFIRTLLIEVIPVEINAYTEEGWSNIFEELKNILETRSTANWPYKIVLVK